MNLSAPNITMLLSHHLHLPLFCLKINGWQNNAVLLHTDCAQLLTDYIFIPGLRGHQPARCAVGGECAPTQGDYFYNHLFRFVNRLNHLFIV